jgi:serine/threonine-protein kinase
MTTVTGDSFLSSGSGGRYYPIARLGRGGMSEVYLAVARGPAGFNKLVVVKRLLANLVSETMFLDMFLDEARLAAQLNHPNIVQTNEVAIGDGTYFIAMEYLEGQPLLKVMQRLLPTPLPVNIALRIGANVSAGLHYAHTLTSFSGTPLGIVHRDVSPQNIFVTYAGQVKVVDFGIAKATGQTTETATGVLKGKIAYMAPEQVGGGAIDGRVDVFSLGVVLYEALTGQRIWGAPTRDVNVLKRLVDGDIPSSPRAVIPSIPEDVDAICRRALAADRDERYGAALEMHKEIQKSIARLPHAVTDHEIGEMVAGMFGQERQAIAKVIEKQLALIDAKEELAQRSLPSVNLPSGVMSLTPAKEASIGASVRMWQSPWRRWTMHRRRTALVAGTVFAVLAAVAVLSFPRAPEGKKAARDPAKLVVPATEAPPPEAVSLPVPAEEPKAAAGMDAAPVRAATAPALVAPFRHPPANVAPRPIASASTEAPAASSRPTANPTYGPLDDRR